MDDLISRQAAIDICTSAIDLWSGQIGEGALVAVRDKISELPSAQSNVHVSVKDADCISRQAAIKAIEDLPNCYNGFSDTYDKACIIGVIDEQPTIEERKKGKWTRDNACPFCGFQPWYERDIHTLSFCPNCGADMRGEQDG